jgi:DNA-binding CsgD family transcriptional regulator
MLNDSSTSSKSLMTNTRQIDRRASDPVDVIPGVLEIAHVSGWSSAHIRHGELSAFRNVGARLDRVVLAAEYRLQRAVTSGRRIAATLQPVSGYGCGICMIVNDGHDDRAIVTLLRDQSLPPFLSTEISLLTLALAAESDRLASVRLSALCERNTGSTVQHIGPSSAPPHHAAFYILDADLTIVMSWLPEDSTHVSELYKGAPIAARLPPILEECVRKLTADWTPTSIKKPGIARPVASLILRIQPLKGPAGQFVSARIDRFVPPNTLTESALRFRFTPREVEVLAKLLDGAQLGDIARSLFISHSTVQDHVRSLLEKSRSRNRTEMIARIFGWESATQFRESS